MSPLLVDPSSSLRGCWRSLQDCPHFVEAGLWYIDDLVLGGRALNEPALSTRDEPVHR